MELMDELKELVIDSPLTDPCEIIHTASAAALCRIGKSPFYGTVKTAYHPKLLLLEYEAYEAWLRTLGSKEITIEEMAQLILNQVCLALGVNRVCITVEAFTPVHGVVEVTIERKWYESQ